MNFFSVVICMMLVTYIPRLLPFLALDVEKIPMPIRKWLNWLPYAALGP